MNTAWTYTKNFGNALRAELTLDPLGTALKWYPKTPLEDDPVRARYIKWRDACLADFERHTGIRLTITVDRPGMRTVRIQTINAAGVRHYDEALRKACARIDHGGVGNNVVSSSPQNPLH